MTLELVPLCTATVTLADTITVSPTFVIGEVTSARFEGERLQASMKGHFPGPGQLVYEMYELR